MRRGGRLFAILGVVVGLAVPGPSWAGGMLGPAIPGSVEGRGMVFQVTDSAYRNVTLSSTAAIDLYMVSASGCVEVLIGKKDEAAEASITIAGLEPAKSYFSYLDGLENKQIIAADASGSISLTLDLSEAHRVLVKESPSTYFLSDAPWTDSSGVLHQAGWSDAAGQDLTFIEGVQGGIGTWDPTTRTALLVQDVSQTLVVLSDNLTLDGNGHAVIGGGAYPQTPTTLYQGLEIRNRRNVTVQNLQVTGTGYGMYIYGGGLHKILENELHGNTYGVYLQMGAGSCIVENNTVVGGYGAISLNGFVWGHTVRGNRVSGCEVATHILVWSGASTFENNEYAGNRVAFQIWGDGNTLRDNELRDNQIAVEMVESMHVASGNTFYHNNFVNNAVQVIAAGTGNLFNLALPEGGNYWSDWASPDQNGDGIVDLPYVLTDFAGAPVNEDALPWTAPGGWITNRAPVFAPVGPQAVVEYDTLTFTVSASDPDADAIVSLTAAALPAGADFDAATGTFSWRPDGTQAGVYAVSFSAIDDGVPSATGRLDVVITVGAIESPTDLTDVLIEDVVNNPDLPHEVENAYVANLKKVNGLIADGKIDVALNQLQAFVQKTTQDLEHGVISAEDGALYLMMAGDVISLLVGNN